MFSAVHSKKNQVKRICQSSVCQRSTTFSFIMVNFTVAFVKICTGFSQRPQEPIHGPRWRICSIYEENRRRKTGVFGTLMPAAMFVLIKRPQASIGSITERRFLVGEGIRSWAGYG